VLHQFYDIDIVSCFCEPAEFHRSCRRADYTCGAANTRVAQIAAGHLGADLRLHRVINACQLDIASASPLSRVSLYPQLQRRAGTCDAGF
jgi:hypothetical protein